MAFINVVRRSMRPEEYTDLRFGWLKRYIYDEKYEIEQVEICDARQISEDIYEIYPEGYRELKKGDLCFTPDGTTFFRAKVSIPESLQGKEIWLSMWTAAEIIVKVNGKYAGGIDPNRDRLLLNPYLSGSEVSIEMEGYNRSKPDDERNPDAMNIRGCRQVFQGLYLTTLHHEVLSLFYDLQLLLDVAKSTFFNEDYRAFLNKELNHALNLIDFDTFREHTDPETGRLILEASAKKELMKGVAEASSYIERMIYANDDFKGSGNVALISHSHLDIAYYWRRIHAVHKNARTVLIQMRLMDRYPDFRYTHTQAYTYELLERYYPELFQELKEKVEKGCFEPVGAMYVEPDCNIPSAESLIRQCLYGQSFFREKFGITVNNCWLPDVFGNSWILPQILKKSGVEYFVSNKMSTWNDTNRFPHNNFIWKGIDGTEVYACVPPTHFITWNMPSQIQENWEAYQDKQAGGQTLSMFGYGDGGSGATEEMLELMHRFNKLSIMPKTEHLGGAEFLEKNLKGNHQLEVWDGELYLEMHRGTFTTKAFLKRENRQLEFLLRDLEILSVCRRASGGDAKQEQIRDIYKKILINQFHDILPGSHIHPVYEDAMEDYASAREAIANMMGNGDEYFNTLNFPRTSVIFVENDHGNLIRCGKRGSFVQPDMKPFEAKEIIFTADEDGETKEITATEDQDRETKEITVTADQDREGSEWLSEDGLRIETPYYRIAFREDGSMESLYDKELDREWAEGTLNQLHIYQDLPGMYDAWDILPNYKEKELTLSVVAPLHRTYADDTLAAYETILSTGSSTWRMILRLFSGTRTIDVENIVDWNEKHKLAKMEFGINVLSRELVCDTSAGYIRRETHKNTSWQKARFEVCTHKWCDLSETDGGLALINDGKYGVGIDGNHITLSLLRATIRPDITSDIGHHEFCYQMVPHAGDHIKARINRLAYEYNIPLGRPQLPHVTPVGLRRLFEDISREDGGLYLQAMKMSENGKSILVRMSEQDGKRGKLRLSEEVLPVNMLEDACGEKTSLIEYKPFEIITFQMEL